jgi:hypothetical protein
VLAGRNDLQPPDHLIRTDCDVITHVRSLVYREQHTPNSCVKWIKFTTKVFWRHFNPSRPRGRRKERKSGHYNWGAVTRVGSHLRHCSSLSTPSFHTATVTGTTGLGFGTPNVFSPPRQCLTPHPWLCYWPAPLFLRSLSRASEYLAYKVYYLKAAPFWRCWW